MYHGRYAVGTDYALPIRIESTLHGFRAQRQGRPPHPRLHIFEHPLDFGIELPCPDLAADVRDAERLDTGTETRSELAAIVGHQKPRHRPTTVYRRLNQLRKILRARPPVIRLHRDDLAAEAIDDRRDLDHLPQHANLGHVQVPDMIRPRWMTHVIGRLGHADLRVLFRRLRRTFLEHSMDRAPVDSDPGAHDVPRDRRPMAARETVRHMWDRPPLRADGWIPLVR